MCAVTRTGALRVVHVDTERTWGGGERQVFELAVGLQALGHRCWVAARPAARLATSLAEAGVPVLGLSPRFEWDPAAAARLRALLRRTGADVVHAHAAHAVALAAMARARTPSCLVASRRVALPLRRNPLSRWKYARADRLIAVSEHVRRVLEAGGIASERISVVRSGVNLAGAPRRASTELLTDVGITGRPLAVMGSALIPPHKDPETFLVALRAARDAGVPVHGLLVGDGPLAAAARRACRRLGLEDVVRLAGFRPDAVELIAAADIAVLSSRDEGLGTTLLDAMVAGVPVVATAAGGVRELVRDGIEGLLTPVGDGGALGAAMVRVLREPALRASLVAAGRERVRHFSIARTVEGTLAAYRAAVSSVEPPGLSGSSLEGAACGRASAASAGEGA